MRSIDSPSSLFQPLEDAIHQELIPALTGREPNSPEERKLLALPVRHGGLNICNPVEMTETELMGSKSISAPLTEMITSQTNIRDFTKPQLQNAKRVLHQQKRERNSIATQETKEQLPQHLQRAMELASEKGASTWLTALPLQDQGFNLNKGEFQDALALRYGWQIKNLPHHCICGKSFSTNHAMTCHHGALPTIRHNEIRDLTANWLSEVYHDVEKEPPLMPLTGETIVPLTANRRDDARADIRARGFWGRQQSAFFDVRVFHPNAPSYRNQSIPTAYRRQEQTKKLEYGDRIRQIEMASFTPLVFSTSGGMGREATAFYKRLADLISNKRNTTYSKAIAWIRCNLAFSLIRSAIMCIRGSRSTSHRVPDSSIELAGGGGEPPLMLTT